MRNIDRTADRLARRQQGVLSHHQLLADGIEPSAIDRRIRTGQWVRLVPGVYALPSHPYTWERQLWVAHLAHPGSAIGLDSAAVLLGHEGYNKSKPHLVLPPGSTSRSSVAHLHRYQGPRLTTVGGLPVTTHAQTIADLCGTSRAPRVEAPLDRLLLTGRLKPAQLQERVDAYAGTRRRGLPFFTALVRERGDQAYVPSESALEDLQRGLVRRLRTRPEVQWQPRLPWRPNTGERLDALLPAVGLILEADGRCWHARVRDFDADRWRDLEAAAAGYHVLRFTWVHLATRIDACATLLDDAIRSRPRHRPAAVTAGTNV